MSNLNTAKFLIGKRKFLRNVNPSDLKEKLKARWYLDTFIEKVIFLAGFFALLYAIIVGIFKFVGLFGG